jgi:phosphate:Na+ symporter
MKIKLPQTPLQVYAPLLFILALGGICGCQKEPGFGPEKIEIVSGNNQAENPGVQLPEPIVVRVLGPRSVDFLGRKGKRRPIEGVGVRFKMRDVGQAGNTGTDVDIKADCPGVCPHPTLLDDTGDGFTQLRVKTDASGLAAVKVQIGSMNADWELDAIVHGGSDEVRFRLVSGIKKERLYIESAVGTRVPIVLRLSRLDPNGDLEPVRRRKVHYRIVGMQAAKLKEGDKSDRTNNEGVSESSLTLGDKPGIYQVLAEVMPKDDAADDGTPNTEQPIRGVLISVVAMDWVLTGLKLVTGILLFVIGVRLLGSGFLLATSRYLSLPTGTWAKNRFRGYFGGLAAGSVFESSSLVTSHLANLSNGGLLTAVGSLGLILGANVGGTLLPQLLAHDIAFLAAPLLAIGALLFLLPRRVGLSSWSWIFVGAGLALTSWTLIHEAAELTSLSEKFKSTFLFGGVDYSKPFFSYAGPFLKCFLVGGAVAFLFRTSNLIVVLAMLLATTSIVDVSTALPLILGANLGSAGMIFVLSVRKRREARRLALSNLLLQLSGCTVAVVLSLVLLPGHSVSVLLWLLDGITPSQLASPLSTDAAQYLATAHTAFNFLAGLFYLFFPGALFTVVDRLLPPRPDIDDVKPFHLDSNLITVPALALRQATEETIYLTELCRKIVAEGFDSFRYNDLAISEQVVRREEVIAQIHREVSQYLVEVSQNQLSRRDASQLEILETAASDLVRIGELGERLRELTHRKLDEQVESSPDIDGDMNEVYDLVMAQFTNILSLLRQRDTKTEENAVKMVERLAKISVRIEAQWRQKIEQAGTPDKPLALYLQIMIYHETQSLLFRVAAHLAHIAHTMRILTPERF